MFYNWGRFVTEFNEIHIHSLWVLNKSQKSALFYYCMLLLYGQTPFFSWKMENFTFFILEFIILLAFHKKKFWGSVILRIFTIIENILIFLIVLVVFVRTTVTSPEVNDLSTQTIWKDYCEKISSLTKSTLLIWPFFCEKPKLTSLKSIIYTISI